MPSLSFSRRRRHRSLLSLACAACLLPHRNLHCPVRIFFLARTPWMRRWRRNSCRSPWRRTPWRLHPSSSHRILWREVASEGLALDSMEVSPLAPDAMQNKAAACVPCKTKTRVACSVQNKNNSRSNVVACSSPAQGAKCHAKWEKKKHAREESILGPKPWDLVS